MAQMFEWSLRDFKVTMINNLEKNVDNMCEQMKNFSRTVETGKTKLKRNGTIGIKLIGLLADWP